MPRHLSLSVLALSALLASTSDPARSQSSTVHSPSSSPDYALQSLRIGQHSAFERLVFDVSLAHWLEEELGGPIPSDSVGDFHVTLSDNRRSIVFSFDGDMATSMRLPTLTRPGLIKSLRWLPGDANLGQVRLRIDTRTPVRVRSYPLHTPARIVIDIHQT